MDDLSELINTISSDPQSMNKLKMLAEGLLSGGDFPQPPPNANTPPCKPDQPDPGFNFSAEDMGQMMKIMKAVTSNERDERTALLISLKPYLSEKRREKVDSAVKLLKLARVLPFISGGNLL